MTTIVTRASRVLIKPEADTYHVGEEVVIDLKTGLLRKKRKGRRRLWIPERFYVTDPSGNGFLTLDITPSPRGGICR